MPDPFLEQSSLAALLAATAAGDENAFARLYAATSPRLFAIASRVLQRRDWAEEALQDVYVRIWQHADSYSPERGAPLAWLATIARYRSLDLLRARAADPGAADDSTQADAMNAMASRDNTEQQALDRAELDRLDQCLGQLPQEQRQIVLLSYYEGFSHSELARKLSAPLGTIKSWSRRGLLRLRDCLGAA